MIAQQIGWVEPGHPKCLLRFCSISILLLCVVHLSLAAHCTWGREHCYWSKYFQGHSPQGSLVSSHASSTGLQSQSCPQPPQRSGFQLGQGLSQGFKRKQLCSSHARLCNGICLARRLAVQSSLRSFGFELQAFSETCKEGEAPAPRRRQERLARRPGDLGLEAAARLASPTP